MRAFERLYSATLRCPQASLILFTIVVFGVVTRGDFSSADTEKRLQVTHWLWSDEPQVVARKVEDPTARPSKLSNPGWCELTGKHGEAFAQFGLGHALIMLPADIVSSWVIDRAITNLAESTQIENPAHKYTKRNLRFVAVNLLTFPVLNALCAVFSYRLLLLLGFASDVAIAATVLLLLATTFVVYMQVTQENNLIYFCYVSALVLIIRAAQNHWKLGFVIAGIFAGYSLLVKLTNVVFVVPLAVMALLLARSANGRTPDKPAGQLKESMLVLSLFGLPVSIFFGIDRLYHWYRFGDWTSTYMKQCTAFYAGIPGYPPGYPFGYDVMRGFLGPLVSINNSVFLFDPFLIFIALFVIVCWCRITLVQRIIICGTIFAFLGLQLAFASTYFWTGGTDWGPRHHLVPVEVMCLIGFAFMIAEFARFRSWVRLAALLDLAVAMACQLIALSMRSIVEQVQIEEGHPVGIVLLMRLQNLYHLLVRDFEGLGLTHSSPDLLSVIVGPPLLLRIPYDLFPIASALSIACWFFLLVIAITIASTIVIRTVSQAL